MYKKHTSFSTKHCHFHSSVQ